MARVHRGRILLGAGLFALTTGGAFAQERPEMAQSSEQTGGIEDIVVTAQRRSENLQAVPVAVTALTGDSLSASGVIDSRDLQMLTPGLVWSTAISVPTPFIRGVGSRDNSAANENSVATYVDGIYYAGMPAALMALPNIERVEVLKGPQGTLFGRNATGGLIQIITREPSQHVSGDVRLTYANYDTVTASAYLSGPLAGDLAADVSIYYTDQKDGWGRNLVNGADVNLTRDFAVRGKLVWTPGASTKITLTGDFDHRQSDIGNALNIVPGATAANGLCGTVAPFPARYPGCAPQPSARFRGTIYDSQSDVYGRSGKNGAQKVGTKQKGISLVVEHEADFATIKSLTSYRRTTGDIYVDQDGSPEPIISGHLDQYDRTLTQELQLASASNGALKWMVGAFYMHREAGYDPFHVFGYALGLASPLDPAGQFGAPPRFGGGFRVFSDVDVDSYSAFGQASYELLPDTNVTAGLRYTSDRGHLKARQIDDRDRALASADVAKTFSKLTYRFSVDHRFSPVAMIYASYNRGFKAGIFNTTSANGSFAAPETLDAFEFGAKTDLFDRHVRFNLSAFHYRYKDLQLPIVVPGGTMTVNAAAARLNGLDFEFEARPIAGLTLSLGGAFLFKARYTRFPGGPVLSGNGVGNIQSAGDLSGNRMIRAPKFTGNASVNYEIPTQVGDFNLNISYYHNSGFFWTPDDSFRQPGYDLVNAQIGWESSDKRLSIRVWGRNLFKQEYYSYLAPVTVGTVAAPGEPRTYGITAGVSF